MLSSISSHPGDRILRNRSVCEKPEMIFSEFDDAVISHAAELFGHVGALEIQIVGHLLTAEGYVEFTGSRFK